MRRIVFLLAPSFAMITAQAIASNLVDVRYSLYALFDHVKKEYVNSPSGNQLWERSELYDAIAAFPTISITVWDGLIYSNAVC